jgi:HTH-type transcriptional regulator/antitoxin HigA
MVYQPNKALHPGYIIQRMIDSLGMTQKMLSERTGLSEKHLSQIINGEVLISAPTALLLENALDGSASYWMNLDKNYRETKARIEQEARIQYEIALAKNFPYADLVKVNMVEDTRVATERVKNLWKFFGVNSLSYIQNTQAVAYKRRDTPSVKYEALASWLRVGELKALKMKLPDYNEQALKQLIPELRKMTIVQENFFPQSQKMLADVGVGFVAVRHFKNTQVNGATRWIGNNPVIQLSIYGRNADKFWFTFFHEIGHILQHGKKQQILEFSKSIKSNEEEEANLYARKILLPDYAYEEFKSQGIFTKASIRGFAQDINIDPGIVVANLRWDGLVEYHQHQDLHTKLEWVK